MAENSESAASQLIQCIAEISQETKNMNPRVEIDTSPPFESVKEAVTHFGGGGPWVPLHLLRLATDQHTSEEFDRENMEEQAVQLEKDLIVKEQETLHVLKELEAAKRFVEGLKLDLQDRPANHAIIASPDLSSGTSISTTPNDKSIDILSLCPAPSPGLISIELNETKSNLYKTTIDLGVIRASVESLNKKMRKEKVLTEIISKRQMVNNVGPDNSTNISREVQKFNFEAEQFKNMADAARYEVMKAMAEMEQTKTSINMVEMRLIAAKKMDEAARAVEAIALAERKALSNNKSLADDFGQKPNGITLSMQEYSDLIHKAKKAEELAKCKVLDAHAMHHVNKEGNLPKVAILRKLEETDEEIKHCNKSLEEVLNKAGGTNSRKLLPEEDLGMRHSSYSTAKFKLRNSYNSNGHRDSQTRDGNECDLIKDRSSPVFRSGLSIGDILSQKLILRDDIVLGRHIEGHTERRGVSLSQMFREQSGLIINSPKTMKDERKRSGFIHVSFPMTKQSKKKIQDLNLR